MYKINIDSENHLSILEPRHAEELYQVIDSNREYIGKWLSFPKKTNKVEDSVTFIEKSKGYPKIMDIGLAFGIRAALLVP